MQIFLTLISKKLSIPLEIIKEEELLSSMDYLRAGRCDIKPLLEIQYKHRIPYTSTQSYIHDSIALVTRLEQPFIYDLTTLNNRKIAINKSFRRFIEFIKVKYPNIILKEVKDTNTGLSRVASGDVFGYIGTTLNSSYSIQKKFSSKLKIINDFETFDFGFGVLNSQVELLSILNKVMSSLTKAEKQGIFNKWITVMVQKDKDYDFVYKILGILSILLLILIYKIYLTNRHYTELEGHTNKIKEAEKRLERLNQTLEEKVQEEVEKHKEIDQQLIYQSRLAQMGEMISMIAHQWRQPLNSISLTSNNLLFKCVMDDIDKELFKKEIILIDEYSQHLSNTIDDFREFFKDNKDKEVTSLTKIVNTTLDIVKTSIENKNIQIVTDLNCEDTFETYSNELKQVILNLIKNAEDILVEKKVINPIITIQSSCTKNPTVRTLIVKDNGGGIPEGIVEQIFDPYFSTKLERDGTGLGLYMSKTIIENHCGGKLSVSNGGTGAIFKIEL